MGSFEDTEIEIDRRGNRVYLRTDPHGGGCWMEPDQADRLVAELVESIREARAWIPDPEKGKLAKMLDELLSEDKP